MSNNVMFKPVQFITDTTGTNVGVFLDIAEYQRLSQNILPKPDPELLLTLSTEELEALATSKLALPTQTRLDELLEKNSESELSEEEEGELDQLLAQIDQLTILKTRARYTLHQYKKAVPIVA